MEKRKNTLVVLPVTFEFWCLLTPVSKDSKKLLKNNFEMANISEKYYYQINRGVSFNYIHGV